MTAVLRAATTRLRDQAWDHYQVTAQAAAARGGEPPPLPPILRPDPRHEAPDDRP